MATKILLLELSGYSFSFTKKLNINGCFIFKTKGVVRIVYRMKIYLRFEATNIE